VIKSRIAVVGALVVLTSGCGRKSAEQEAGTLRILCGAGIRPAMEAVRAEFERAHNCTVRADYAGSGAHFGRLQAGAEADLWLPGDVWWVHKAYEKGLVDRHRVVAWFVPVIAVQKGNPKKIRGLPDLLRKELAVGLGKIDACAIGNVSLNLLTEAGIEDRVEADFEALTVNRLANQVKIRALDAAIIWDAVARQYPDDIEIVQVQDSDFHAVALAMATLKQTGDKELADKFAEFVAGDFGAKCFRENHYRVPGKQLRVGCGGSMRPPVEELAKLFRKQTGCRVLCDYGGSGPVLLQIEESKEGDIYICHDPFAYTCEEKKISERWHTIAYMEPILAVRKGNPKGVKGLKDLLRNDLKIGLSHREYSTRGRILWAMFRKRNIAGELQNRKFFEERTHTLVNQLKLGAIDIATLWDAPAKTMPEIDVVPIEDEYKVDAVTSATTGRTYSVTRVKVTVVRLNFSNEPLLAAQFAKLCLSEAGRKILQKHCFVLPDNR